MQLSVVIPAFNEAPRIAGTLDRLRSAASDLGVTEIVVVDDGSVDGTASVVQRAEAVAAAAAGEAVRVVLVAHEQNRGKGAALRSGARAATGEVVAFLDADSAVPPEALRRGCELIADGADMVIGTRVTPAGDDMRASQPLLRRLLGRVFVRAQRAIVGVPYTDTQCPFKMLRREAAVRILDACTVDRWTFDVELIALALRQRLRIVEMPVTWAHMEGSTLRLTPRTAFGVVRDLISIRRALRAR